MPRKQRRGNAFDRAFRTLDMFGHRLGFNINGEDVYRTNTGSCFTLIIFFLVAVVAQWRIREVMFQLNTKPLTSILYPNHFDEVPLRQQHGFQFAVGVSSVRNFDTEPERLPQNYTKF